MLAGKPVVSFAGGAKGVRHLHDAYIVPNHDVEALGRGIVKLLEDRKLAEEMGARARATVLAEFDWRQICRKIERIYDQLLGFSPVPAATPDEPVPAAQPYYLASTTSGPPPKNTTPSMPSA